MQFQFCHFLRKKNLKTLDSGKGFNIKNNHSGSIDCLYLFVRPKYTKNPGIIPTTKAIYLAVSHEAKISTLPQAVCCCLQLNVTLIDNFTQKNQRSCIVLDLISLCFKKHSIRISGTQAISMITSLLFRSLSVFCHHYRRNTSPLFSLPTIDIFANKVGSLSQSHCSM